MSRELLQALQNSALYDHPVTDFQLVETHISWVLLTGDFAYKIKKPVNFGFLNFSTLALREQSCEEEIRLNRRLAPELYLGVVPIRGNLTAPNFGTDGEILEYAVKMRQFDQQQLLDRVQARGELDFPIIDRLAERIAGFHRSIAVANADHPFGNPQQLLDAVLQNFKQIRPALQSPAEAAQLDQLQAWAESSYTRLSMQLQARKSQGYVREAHGDLHLGNIFRVAGDVTLFDCIEFNPALSWIDVLSDIAFLIMDLEYRHEWQLAHRLLNHYLEHSGDYAGLALLNFYKAYRAMVRAKVALLSLQQSKPDTQAEAELRQRYRSYADLAEAYSGIPKRCLLITQGVSGSGKSTLSGKLVDRLGLIRLRSDIERKRLHDLPALAASGSTIDGGIYDDRTTHDTYQRLAQLSQQLLAAGYGVIVDATFLKRWQRQLLEQVAEDQGVPFVILSCEADPQQIRTWIAARAAKSNDASEATLEVLDRQLAEQELITGEESTHRVHTRTDNPKALEPLLDLLSQRLQLDLLPQ